MTDQEFALRITEIKHKLYKTALLYMGNETLAVDVLDEAVYKGLRNARKLRQPEFFTTWMTRILINECHREHKRQNRFRPLSELPETAVEEFDSLPLKEAIQKLPQNLKDLIILRYFSGYTLAEAAQALDIPQGTAATRQRKALALLKLDLGEEDA